MTPVYEKRPAAPAGLLPINREIQDIEPVTSDNTRKPWSERYSVTLDPLNLIALLLGHSAVVMSVFAAFIGGH